MDITTIGYYIMIVPVAIFGLAAGACLLWVLYGLAKLTIEAWNAKYCIGLAVCLLLWWLLIGIGLIVIGDLT